MKGRDVYEEKRTDWILLASCIVIVYTIGLAGTIFTSPSIESGWYDSVKLSIAPPNWTFGVVWNILFLLIGISLYLAFNKAERKIDRKRILLTFGINLGLNLLWSFLFFGLQNPLLAFIEIFFLLASIVFMMRAAYLVDKNAMWLLVPYLLWVSFAIILNGISAF